jgi:hypothetical protein
MRLPRKYVFAARFSIIIVAAYVICLEERGLGRRVETTTMCRGPSQKGLAEGVT